MTPTLAPYVQAAGLCVPDHGLPMLAVFFGGALVMIVGLLLMGHAVAAYPATWKYRISVGVAAFIVVYLGALPVNGMFFIGTGNFCG